jgi:dihydrodipicolinate synthase/N-acetylneuraminate lyase
MPFDVIPALVTPFDEHGRVDLDAFRMHVRWLVGEGVDGLLVGGTTGEGALLDETEMRAMIAAAVDEASGTPVMAQVGVPGTAATCARIDDARALGVSSVTAVAPYYFRLTQEQLLAHYRALLAHAGSLPLYAYNIPSRTVNDIEAPIVAMLAAEGLAGVKDSTKSLDRLHEYIACAPAGSPFGVFVGSDSLALPALDAGSAGIVSALANVRPDLLRAVREASEADDQIAADRVQAEILELRAAFSSAVSLAGLKVAVAAALAGRGSPYPTALRPPLT